MSIKHLDLSNSQNFYLYIDYLTQFIEYIIIDTIIHINQYNQYNLQIIVNQKKKFQSIYLLQTKIYEARRTLTELDPSKHGTDDKNI